MHQYGFGWEGSALREERWCRFTCKGAGWTLIANSTVRILDLKMLASQKCAFLPCAFLYVSALSVFKYFLVQMLMSYFLCAEFEGIEIHSRKVFNVRKEKTTKSTTDESIGPMVFIRKHNTLFPEIK